MAGLATPISEDAPRKIEVDKVDTSTVYIGVARLGSLTSAAVWQIQKLSVSGTVTQVLTANASDAYDQIWDNRAGLSYS